jgi:ATP-binding cassette subfamily C exporter for protease/lipase
VTVILVTHRPQTARVCDKVMFLREGKVEAFGPAEQVLNALARSPRARPQPQPQPPEPVRLPAVPHSSWG